MRKSAWCVPFDPLYNAAIPVVVAESPWPYGVCYDVLQPLHLFFEVVVVRPLGLEIAREDVDLSCAR